MEIIIYQIILIMFFLNGIYKGLKRIIKTQYQIKKIKIEIDEIKIKIDEIKQLKKIHKWWLKWK